MERLEEEPLEDGITHPAETLVRDVLLGSSDERSMFLRYAVGGTEPELFAAVIRLVGRVGLPREDPWRRRLVKLALSAASLVVREAAVEAVEQWEATELLPLLRKHNESVPWLKDYIEDVIDDLSE